MADRKKIFCNTCKYETHHELKSHHYREDVETFIGEYENGRAVELMGYWQNWNYHFWVCLGCDTATLEEQYTGAEMQDQHINEYFPDRTNTRRSAKQFLHIDKKINAIYKETITAYQQNMLLLCAIGARAILEGICSKEGITGKKKIDVLGSHCNIPDSIIEGLKSLTVFGNDAVHRLDATTKHNAELAIDLLEALLTNLYEAKFDLEHKAKRLNGEPVSIIDCF